MSSSKFPASRLNLTSPVAAGKGGKTSPPRRPWLGMPAAVTAVSADAGVGLPRGSTTTKPGLDDFRLISTSLLKPARHRAQMKTVQAEESRERYDVRMREAECWEELTIGLYRAVTSQHLRLNEPSTLPLTNAIEGVPLLASVFVAPSPPTVSRKKSTVPEKAASATATTAVDAKHTAQLRAAMQTMEAARKFDDAVRQQRSQSQAFFSETSNQWLPQNEVQRLYSEWVTFALKWMGRPGATISALLSSFLCTILVDDEFDDSSEPYMEHVNRIILEETMELVTDVVDPTHKKEEALDDCVSYASFCYVLRNVAVGLHPSVDMHTAVRHLVATLCDRVHRVHY